LLQVEDLEVAYGNIVALHGISLEVHPGEISFLVFELSWLREKAAPGAET
jgi:ABC-type sugar transport system ATPase subunit